MGNSAGLTKCKLCSHKAADLEAHWILEHPAEWKKLQQQLQDIDEKLEGYRRLAAEGMIGATEGTGGE